MTRPPDGETDGWLLRNSVETHEASPESFWSPPEAERRGLEVGDYAKLVFEIWLDEPEDAASVERMWVVVREVTPTGYFGRLDNEPDAIAPNDEFWLGVEVPFGPEHVIDIQPGDDASRALAAEPPLRSWPRA